VSGPEEEIERFEQTCLFLDPKDDKNGIDFQRVIPMPDELPPSKSSFPNWYLWSCANWGTKWPPLVSRYWVEDGCHKIYLETAWSPPLPVFLKIVEMFPMLSFVDFDSTDEEGLYFIKGTISAAGVDLHEDEEAKNSWEAACREAEPRYLEDERETG
jgi:hypothetical protein